MDDSIHPHCGRIPWNKGKLIGQKLPLKQREIWRIRANLEHEHNVRELALFDLAIDSKLRACDLTALRVSDVMRGDQVVGRTCVLQAKTQRPVRFEITDIARAGTHCLDQAAQPRPGRLSVSQPLQESESPVDAPVRTDCRPLGDIHPPRSKRLWHAHLAADQADVDLPAHRQPACCPATAWTYQDREHGALSRRGGR